MIPTIEYRDLKTNKNIPSKLEDTLNEVGFFIIKNHPISEKSIDKLFSITENLFNLPINIKNKYHLAGTNGARGYTPYGIETALNEKLPDQKEFWHQGSNTNKNLQENLYLTELNDFDFIDKMYMEFENVGIDILKAFKNFNFDYHADLTEIAENGNSILRLIHYPKVESNTNHQRARAHNDVNLITLLVGGNAAGLEAQDKSGNWVECNCQKNEIICNVGDMLEIISKQKLRSTPHRVVSKSNSNVSRYSIPFFLHPRPEVILDPITQLSADEFLTKRLKDIKLN